MKGHPMSLKSGKTIILSCAAAAAAASQIAPAFAASHKTFTGPVVQYQYGALQVQIVVSKKHIVKVRAAVEAADGRSAQVDARAIPILKAETLKAQSGRIDTVSGATATSEAYIQSVERAVSQAHKKKDLKS
jgi:hypothetical protein